MTIVLNNLFLSIIMANPQLEAEVWQLREEVKELTLQLEEMRKYQLDNSKIYSWNIRDILNREKEIDVKFLDFSKSIEAITKWQEWIDKIIEKIKKFLPI